MILIFGLCLYCNPKWISHIPCTIILALVSVRVVHCRQSHARLPELHVEMMRRVAPKRSSITTNHFPSSSIRRYQFHHWLRRGPVDKRAGRSVAHAGSHARFRRHPAKGSRVASPRLLGCPRSAEAEVHLSGCAQHSGSVPFGNCAGATWPGGAPLLRTIFYSPKSHQLLLIPLSLYNSHPAWPFRPRRVHQFSRAAARRLVHISPPRLSLLLDFTDLPCFTVPSSRGSGSCPLPASTAHAMHMADLLPQIGIAADMPLLPR